METMRYFYPVDKPKVTCGFGVLGKAWRCGWHCGVDYSNLNNSKIYAIADGVIVGVNHLKGTSYGSHVEVRHGDGHSSLYAHLSSVYVKKGEGVKGGQVLGLMGSTGTSAKHLHIEVYTGKWRYPPQNSRPSMAAWYVDCHKFIGEKMEEGKQMEAIKDSTVRIGGQNVAAKLIDGITYVALRPMVAAMKEELIVTWDEKTGASIKL